MASSVTPDHSKPIVTLDDISCALRCWNAALPLWAGEPSEEGKAVTFQAVTLVPRIMWSSEHRASKNSHSAAISGFP